MATLNQMIPRIFKHAWQRYGKPTMQAVRPISYWALPAGFAYDQDVDAIRNAAGVVLTNHADYWVTDTIYIVPTRSNPRVRDVAELQELLVTGSVTIGTVEVWILNNNNDLARVREAHAILLGDQWYNLDNQQPAPSGYPDSTGLWSRVRLRGRT